MNSNHHFATRSNSTGHPPEERYEQSFFQKKGMNTVFTNCSVKSLKALFNPVPLSSSRMNRKESWVLEKVIDQQDEYREDLNSDKRNLWKDQSNICRLCDAVKIHNNRNKFCLPGQMLMWLLTLSPCKQSSLMFKSVSIKWLSFPYDLCKFCCIDRNF